MKRVICLITLLCIVFSSFSFCFGVDWSTTDQTNLSNAASRLYYSGQSAAYYLYNIATNTNNLYNKAVDIYNSLNYGSHSISYWVNSISTWMSPIFNAITNVPLDLNTIIGALGYYDSNSTYHPYLIHNSYSAANLLYDLTSGHATNNLGQSRPTFNSDGSITLSIQSVPKYSQMISWGFNDLKNINAQGINNNLNFGYKFYNSSQNATNWGNLSTSTFTPNSAIDGIYKWLSAIQSPVARLSYVLASQERIEAQAAAAANEEAVVDNFIDSTGDGSASPSNIGSISDLSSGYKSNFGSDANVTGIFNIFNSNNMGWFSQETANQLDTTPTTRRGFSFDTPLLDQQINDIYDQIGVKHD